jgi:cold shock CspA family protein
MAQGTIKDYTDDDRTGSLLLDDRTEVFIDEASLEGSGVRSLRIGQRVSLEVAEENGRKVARNLRIVTFS